MYSQTRLPAARKRGRWVLAVPFWSVQAKGLAIDKRGGATTIIEVVRLSAAGAHDKSGHSSVWLERTVRDREVAGSNPVAPTRSMNGSSHPFAKRRFSFDSNLFASTSRPDDWVQAISQVRARVPLIGNNVFSTNELLNSNPVATFPPSSRTNAGGYIRQRCQMSRGGSTTAKLA